MLTHVKYCISATILLLLNGVMSPVLADDAIDGTSENDVLVGSAKDDVIRGGFGNDLITGKNGDDDIFGNSGNDTIDAGKGDDNVYPGPGADEVSAGRGDDHVTIYDICEISAGEVLDGGEGDDLLTIPVDLPIVQSLGVAVVNFEEIRVDSSNRCQSDCTIPCTREPKDLANLPDPESWSKDAGSGLRYRRMTRAEREANGFEGGAYFIETAPGLIDQLISGTKPTSKLIVPTADSRVYPLQFGTPILAAEGNITKLQRNLVPGASNELVTTTTKPVVFEYTMEGFEYDNPASIEDAIVSVLVGSDSGVYGSGLVGEREVRLWGTNRASQWLIVDSIPDPDPPIVEPNLLVVSNLELGEYGAAQAIACHNGDCTWICANTGTPCGGIPDTSAPPSCNDTLDNDGDGGIDNPGDEECTGHPANCSHPDPDLRNACWGTDTAPFFTSSWESGKSYGLFGEGTLCSLHPESWFEEMLGLARQAQQLVNTVRGDIILPNGLRPLGFEMKVRFVAGGCWIFPGPTIAARVDAADTCNQTGDCGDVAGFNSYPYRASGDLSKGFYGKVWDDVYHGATQSDLRDVLHMAQVLYNGQSTTDIDCQEEGVRVSCCGEHLGSKNYSSVPIDYRGAGFIKVGEEGCGSAYGTIAHEMGHSMGLMHDTEQIDHFPGFMNMGGGIKPIITEANWIQLVDCLADWECPRPSGFKYSVDNCPACP